MQCSERARAAAPAALSGAPVGFAAQPSERELGFAKPTRCEPGFAKPTGPQAADAAQRPPAAATAVPGQNGTDGGDIEFCLICI